MPRVDLERIGQDVDAELRGVYITAQAQEPPPGPGEPALAEPPDSDDVNHRSYAFQWFALALIPIVGWPIFLTRAHRRGQRTPKPADDQAQPERVDANRDAC